MGGQVCAKHDQYYEKACPWCEEPEVSPVIMGAEEWNARIAEASAIGKASVCDHRKSGICSGCGADILLVSMSVPAFKAIPTFAELMGAETIGPGESKFWMDFINTRYCKDDGEYAPLPKWPEDKAT